ncbi:MAG: MarR family transcriptional regulator [Desulfobacteraceae bacterium]|nr:MarR family transcriptional regulator [Desulfobacteraceae bacterium]
MAQQKLRTYLKDALAMEGVRVTPAQAGILFLLKKKNGQSMTELSQFLSIDNSTITGLVDRLEKSGFASRNASTSDRRMFRIFITPQGIEESNKAKTTIKRVNEEIKSGFSREDIEIFKRILNSFLEKFNKV